MFTIMTNPTAIGAQGSVNNANNTLSKTIQQLSTGLRINSSADDASGMAVSEKLRGQISGLKMAARNAQDGISFLQTAESNMGTMTSMVQRIRELAVQAGDPAYTASDRVMLQTEVDQLKNEVDRVSTSAEFNTKKLLNGDAAALWSGTGGIDAIVKGTTIQGNYNLETVLTPGTNNVYKSNVMAIGAGQIDFNLNNTTGIARFDNMTGMMRVSNTAGTTNLYTSTANVTASSNASVLNATGAFLTSTTLSSVVSNFGVAAAGNINALDSYTVEIEMTSNRSANGTATFQYRVRNAVTGQLSDWNTGNIGATGMISASSTPNLVGLGGVVFTAGTSLGLAGGASAKKGDKMLIGVQSTVTRVAATDSANVSVRSRITGAMTSALIRANLGLGLGSGRNYVNAVSATQNKSMKYYTAQMDSSGKVYYGSMDIVMDKMATAKSGTAIAKVLVAGDTASSFTKLSQISRFTNADGRMVLDNPRDVTIYGNGKQAILTLDKNMTIADLEKAMTSAIVDQLGMGAVGGGAGGINNNLVNYVYGSANATSNGVLAGSNQAMEGTFVIQTAMLGNASSLSFSADQGVLDALNIGQVQTAKESSLTVNVRNAHTGDLLNTTVSSDGIAKNVVKNVDVKFNMANEANMAWNSATRTLEFTQKAQAGVQKLHLVNNATIAAIGANEGQTLDISIGRMDTTSLNIADVNVLTVASSQKAITQLDQALDTINKGRAVVGAQMNRLNYTINNLNVSRENMMAAESRIRDLDIAEASTNLAAQQVRLQAATAMLAQANQLPSYAAQLLR